jgi:hypothetical protein
MYLAVMLMIYKTVNLCPGNEICHLVIATVAETLDSKHLEPCWILRIFNLHHSLDFGKECTLDQSYFDEKWTYCYIKG